MYVFFFIQMKLFDTRSALHFDINENAQIIEKSVFFLSLWKLWLKINWIATKKKKTQIWNYFSVNFAVSSAKPMFGHLKRKMERAKQKNGSNVRI